MKEEGEREGERETERSRDKAFFFTRYKVVGRKRAQPQRMTLPHTVHRAIFLPAVREIA